MAYVREERNEMPMYKGEFQRAAKRRPIREVLPIPALRSPPAGHQGSSIEEAFASDPRQLPPEERQVFRWQGGETAGLEHLRNYIDSGQLASYRGATESFAHGEDNPVNSGTRLSPWLAFGCLSARMVVKEAREYERKHGKTSSGKGIGKIGSTGTRLHTELLFRDFLRFSALAWGTSLFKIGGPFHVKGLEWSHDMELFQKWREGNTGFPFVDAGMRELAATGYISHLHRQCCAAFLVRDLRLDWRMGAEHFESCLLDHTPDANWGNWAYRILQRPCLVETRAKYPVEEHVTTVEVVAWPAVHDARLDHTLRWCPELSGLSKDLAREPWLLDTVPDRRISIKPYKDSPLWFCAANRTNWDYEYFWLPGHAWTVKPGKSEVQRSDFQLGKDYPRPLVPPLNVELDLDALPVKFHGWGTEPAVRRHVWGGRKQGRPPTRSDEQSEAGAPEARPRWEANGKGKGTGKRGGKGKGHQPFYPESGAGCQNQWQKRRREADWRA
ncbi:CRYD [Symbiodinium pilosum]|uniref:CRYD protein n=1 Tax=Symbiodinium pilosum TaxID=2952 RepID=A0A812QPK3_SYMPI|nr:CRYD [Symbiodinium pilosum]